MTIRVNINVIIKMLHLLISYCKCTLSKCYNLAVRGDPELTVLVFSTDRFSIFFRENFNIIPNKMYFNAL